ncbi:MAG: universal stress protein [Rhodobacteraceae bacterium]|nr:universal stress protein [Paracoccaceae bacterium]
MRYRSFFTVWDGQEESRSAIDLAIEMTRRASGHLDVLCLGIDRVQPGFYYAGAAPALLQEGLAAAQAEAEAREASARAILEPEDIAWSCRSSVTQIGGLLYVVGRAARFADLTVLPRPYGRPDAEEGAAVLEAALFEGDASLLVVPPGTSRLEANRIVVGWNESQEALRAVRAAMPLLTEAEAVDIVIVDPGRQAEDEADPGSELSAMLARHGVSVSVSVLAKTRPGIADTMARHVVDTGADLMVMGAYGHSRFRQSILGGATRDTLENAKVPVLMAH